MIINIGGVPEHFNFPFHHTIIAKAKVLLGISLQWSDYAGGTGAMCADLRTNTLDMAIVLTEGIVADISKGNPCKLVQWYVESPLVWGIHVHAHSKIYSPDDFVNKKIAISRPGSGSHLMAYVEAQQRGNQLKESDFVVVGNLSGAVQALSQQEADLFFWEQFTTKPYVDQGVFRKVSTCPTPWPCFAIAVTNTCMDTHGPLMLKLMDLITAETIAFKTNPEAAELIAAYYHLPVSDVALWLKTVQWKSDFEAMNPVIIQKVIDTLRDLALINKPMVANEVIY
jgi:sulfonate transport system substrate-binding protein